MKNFLSFIVYFITVVNVLSYQDTFYHVDDLGGGGAVPKIIPAYSSSMGIDALYARTDNGGVYKNSYSSTLGFWGGWVRLNSYILDIGGLAVQGLAVKPDNPNVVIIGCGTFYQMDDNDQSTGIWRSTNGGGNWTRVNSSIMFEGVRDNKNGGECIYFDRSNYNIVYAGGRYYEGTNQYSKLYKSTDAGATWNQVGSSTVIHGVITSISMCANDNNTVWIGTTIEYPNESQSWSVLYTLNKSSSTINAVSGFGANTKSAAIHNVVFHPDASSGYGDYGFIGYGKSGGLMKTTNKGVTWTDITSTFDNSSSTPIYQVGFYRVPSTEEEESESAGFSVPLYYIIASRMDAPTRISTNYGTSFVTVSFSKGESWPYNAPKHVHTNEQLNWGRNNITQHAVRYSELYMSNGQGTMINTSANPSSSSWTWYFNTRGINQINSFRSYADARTNSPQYVLLSIADWFSGRVGEQDGSYFTMHDYGNSNFDPYYTTSITRIVKRDGGTSNLTYYLGAENVNSVGRIYSSTDYGATFSDMTPYFINEAYHPVVDAIAAKDHSYPNAEPKILMLVGGERVNGDQYPHKYRNETVNDGMTIDESWDEDNKVYTRGVYFTYDGGSNWFLKNGGIDGSAYLPPLFNYNRNLAYDNNNSYYKYYLYFKGNFHIGWGDPGNSGFVWTKANSNPYIGDNMLQEGSVIVDPAGPSDLCILGTSEFNNTTNYLKGGFVKGVPNTTTGGMTFTNISGWKSVTAFDVYNKYVVIFGKQTNDSRNYLYRGTFNNTYTAINNVEQIAAFYASTIDLKIIGGAIWIGTGGEGYHIVTQDGGEMYSSNSASNVRPGMRKEGLRKYELNQNYPNPFNPTTNISYSLAKDEIVKIKVYDILGKQVAELVNEFKSAGNYSVQFDAGKFNLSSGIYFYSIQTSSFNQIKKMSLIK